MSGDPGDGDGGRGWSAAWELYERLLGADRLSAVEEALRRCDVGGSEALTVAAAVAWAASEAWQEPAMGPLVSRLGADCESAGRQRLWMEAATAAVAQARTEGSAEAAGIGDVEPAHVDPRVLDDTVADIEGALRSRKVADVRAAVADALRLLSQAAPRLAPALRALCSHRSRAVVEEVRAGVRREVRGLAVSDPGACRVILQAFSDGEPELWRELINAAAEAGYGWAVDRVSDTEPLYYRCWLRGDSPGFAAAVRSAAGTGTGELFQVVGSIYAGSTRRWPRGRNIQLIVDGIHPCIASAEPDVRIVTIATLAACAAAGANVEAAVPALLDALTDEHRKKSGLPSEGLWWHATAGTHAALALGQAVGAVADPAFIVAGLQEALSQRRGQARQAAAFGLGVVSARLGGDFTALEAVLGRRELVYAAVEGVMDTSYGQLAPSLVDWLVANDFDPAWCFESESAFHPRFAPHVRVQTREGLGILIDHLAGRRRGSALGALAAAASNGSDVTAAVPAIAGTLLCGDWRVSLDATLECLRDIAKAGRSVASVARWLPAFLVPGRPGARAAAEVARLAVAQGADGRCLVEGLTAVAAHPFDTPGSDAASWASLAASREAAAALAALASRGTDIGNDFPRTELTSI
ncbi:hypothetical protein OG905_38625 [Streptomyces sp. NBC_00322]|uniref:hypothetical protein n=2 Tax=unclassified Streptomyces TaxID=2593676 RepID=UPI002E2DBBD3|nr:hypothetical protein [Streptomyces sp. NBC_00322]